MNDKFRNRYRIQSSRLPHWDYRSNAEYFPYVSIDEFVVMPDHIHGIIIIDNHESLLLDEPVSQPRQQSLHPPKTGSLSVIIRSYKSAVTKNARDINPQFAWQDRFYDHIIRDDGSFERIACYIKKNVINWGK